MLFYHGINPKFMQNIATNSSRVATAQGKRGIWMLTFPDREIELIGLPIIRKTYGDR